MTSETSKRKLDHIEICLQEDVESRLKRTGFEEIEFIPRTDPEMSLSSVKTETSLFGKELNFPIIICPMTGGHERGKEINLALAEAAQKLGIGMAVGSQRAGIEDSSLEETYEVRDVAPDIPLFGNLGAVQLAQSYGAEEARKAIEMINADALGLHFNPLQEAVQPSGDTDFEDTLKSVSDTVSEIDYPVYAKETGAGINASTALRLEDAGVRAIDVSGAGGTSWAGVEAFREDSSTSLGEVFWDWGLPTSVSTAEVSESVDIPVISSGGIRTGLDASKAISLGADFVGIGLPLFRASVRGKDEVVKWLEEFIKEFEVAMFLTGCEDLSELKRLPLHISGRTREWFESRDLGPEEYRRGC